MIAEQLRKSILQAAIQGKLTEQLPEDGDARDLLIEIQKEKAQLITEGKIKKEKQLPEITDDEIPFDIPENWCWARLGEIFRIARGGSPRPIQAFLTTDSNGINWIKIGDTEIGGKYINETKEKIKPEGLKKSRLVKPGDLLLTNSMSFGRPYILNTHGCIHDGWLVLSPMLEKLYKEYFFYLLSSEFIHMAFANTVAGAVVKNLNSDKVRTISVPLPPLAEQKRIVNRLEELTPEIDKLKSDTTKLESLQKSFPKKMKNSILQYAIQGKLTEQLESDGDARDLLREIQKKKEQLIIDGKIKREKPLPEITDDEIPFDIPDNWCWVRLGEINDINPRNKINDEIPVSFVPMILLDEGFSNSFTCEERLWKDVKSGFTHFSNGDIVVAKITPCFQNRKSAVMRGLINNYGTGTTELNVIRPIGNLISSHYLLYLFKTEYFIYNGVLSMTGTAGQQRVGKTYIQNFIISLPPLAEQHRIVERLNQLLPLCDTLE